MDLQHIRHQMRGQRRGVTGYARQRAASRLAMHLQRIPHLHPGSRVACFLATDGEIDPMPWMRLAHQHGVKLYLPVVPNRPGALRFARFRPGMRLRRNRFGIHEPPKARFADPRSLDWVLTPLVAFDMAGNRIGMGGGYYDRTFANLRHRRRWRKPRLVGLAYGFQRVGHLPANPWDVPLWGVCTERYLSVFAR